MKKWMVFATINALTLMLIITPSAHARNNPALLKATERTRNGSGLGTHTAIKLTGCDSEIIRSAGQIKRYLRELCQLAAFKAYGDAHIAHCGTEYAGYSAMQLLDKGHIIVHSANNTNCIHLAISNSSAFDAYDLATFSQDFFRAENSAVKTIQV
jgi:S-adenosylmethionine/arginine decarboxylase-like enzyme